MKTKLILLPAVALLLTSCTPRDFLSRRLAYDLIVLSDVFRTPRQIVIQTGVVSNKDYPSPEYLVLQQRGWISATNSMCPFGLTPPPCWDILLTPSGVETARTLAPGQDLTKPSFSIPAARRELVAITGISKQGSTAEVEFTWRWIPLNEVGAALYSSDARYKSTVGFRNYDDGWRLVTGGAHPELSLEAALKNAEAAP